MPAVVVDSLELANRLRPALLQLNRYLRREAHAEGMTGGQASLLSQISNDPAVGIKELAAREGVSAPAMTRAVDRLEKAQLVTRGPSPDDGRRVRLALTPTGVRALRSVRRRRTAWLAERMRDLSAAELAVVDAAIEPLLRLVEESA